MLTEEDVRKILSLDYEAEVQRIAKSIRYALRTTLHKRGLVVAVSGGIDSSVCAALAVRALGRSRVLGISMPEIESSKSSADRAKELAHHLGMKLISQDVTNVLQSIGCYERRDDSIRRLIPEYGVGWKSKIAISGGLKGGINHFFIVAEGPKKERLKKRLDLNTYRTIVAATNYKQRVRKTVEYFWADKFNYAVVGTPNHLEFDQGFFVKNGDGAADLKPIAHLYKTQVYEIARFMGLPREICNAKPTTDTYTLEQGQDEFYFGLPYHVVDVALFLQKSGRSDKELAELLNIEQSQAQRIFQDLVNKRSSTENLHNAPLLF